MGVTGLWKLIEQSGKPVPVETLEGKILAIDISIWLHQTVKGYQDGKGGAVQNAHLIGLFNRLCKLLFYRIKPVFVFDGGCPQLKRITIAKRSMQRSKTQQEANRVEQVLLEALANEKLVQQALGKSPKDIVSPRKAKQLREAAQKRQEDDLYALPPLENELGVTPLPLELSDDEEEEDNKLLGDLEIAKIDVTHPLFKQLPADKRHAILFELKETRKQSSWGRLHEMPADANNFAEFQMKRLLKRRNVQVSLEEAELEMGGKSLTLMELDQLMREDGIVEGAEELKGQRIASNENARFVYIKDTLKAIEESKKTLEEEKTKQKIETIPEEDVDLQMAIAMSLQNDDISNLAPLPVAKDTDIKLSTPQREKLRDANKGPAREYMLEFGHVNDEVIKDMFQHKEKTKTKEEDAISITSSTDSDFVDVPEEDFSHETIVPMIEPFPLPEASPSKDFRLEDLKKSEIVEVKIDLNAGKVDDLFADIFKENTEETNKRPLEDDSDDLNKTQPLDMTEYEHILNVKSPSPAKKLKIDSIEDEIDEKSTEIDVKENEVDAKESKINDEEAEIDVKSNEIDEKESKTDKNELKTPEKNVSIEQKRLEMLKKIENELKMLKSDVKNENKRPEIEISEFESSPKKLFVEVTPKKDLDTIEILDSQEEKIPDVSIIDQKSVIKAIKPDSYEIIDLLSPKQSPSKVQIASIIANNVTTAKEPIASSSKFVPPPPIPTPTIQHLPEDEETLRQMQQELAAKSRSLQQEMNKKDRFAVSVTEQMSTDCQDLLKMFGIPYVVAPMEAEAECAFLNKHGLVDGIISDDSDVWLFGGSCVYKNFFDNKKIVLEYRAESIKNLFHLDQKTLIQLGMLVGSDYTSGIQGIGTVTAMEVISAFSSNNNDHTDEAISVISSLRKFRDWWMNGKECTAPHLTELKKKLKKVSLIEGFPNLDVVKAYLYPEVDLNDEPFSWGMPDIEAIMDMTRRKLGWTKNKTEDLLTPVMKKLNEKQTQSSIRNYFKTKEITSHKDLVVSKRTEKSIRRLAGDISAEKETKKKKKTQKKPKAGPSKEEIIEEVLDANNPESPPRKKGVKYVRPSPKKTPEKKESLRKREPRIPDPNPVIPQLVKRQEEMEENKKKAAKLFKKSKK